MSFLDYDLLSYPFAVCQCHGLYMYVYVFNIYSSMPLSNLFATLIYRPLSQNLPTHLLMFILKLFCFFCPWLMILDLWIYNWAVLPFISAVNWCHGLLIACRRRWGTKWARYRNHRFPAAIYLGQATRNADKIIRHPRRSQNFSSHCNIATAVQEKVQESHV